MQNKHHPSMTSITACIISMQIGESKLFPKISVERVRNSWKTAKRAGITFRCHQKNLGTRVERIA